MPGRRRFAGGALTVTVAALFWLPGAALSQQPRFICPWSVSVAALCLAYDAQRLAATFGDPQPTRRGVVTTVVPATPAEQPSYGVARAQGPRKPAYAIAVQGSFPAGPNGERSTGWLVAFVERATGRLSLVLGPGVARLGDVLPAGAGPLRALPAPPPWPAECAVRALQRSQVEFVVPLLRARDLIRKAHTPVARTRALAALRRLQARVGPRATEIAAHTC